MSQMGPFSTFFGTKKELFGNQDHARKGLLDKIENHLFFVAEHESHGPIGFISGWVLRHPYNPELKVLTETMWWVDEKFRHSRAGLLLLNEFTEWGKNFCDWITFSLQEKTPVKERSLLKRGFHLQEKSFLMEVS